MYANFAQFFVSSLFVANFDQALARYNRQFNWELKRKMMGRSHSEAVMVLLKECGLANEVSVEEYDVFYKTELQRLFPDSPLMPGAERLVAHLASHHVSRMIGGCSR